MNPDGPTIKVLNGYLSLPQAPETIARAPMYEAAVLNQSPETLPGRDITARGMGDDALVERRADDPNFDLYGGRRRDQRTTSTNCSARRRLTRGPNWRLPRNVW